MIINNLTADDVSFASSVADSRNIFSPRFNQSINSSVESTRKPGSEIKMKPFEELTAESLEGRKDKSSNFLPVVDVRTFHSNNLVSSRSDKNDLLEDSYRTDASQESEDRINWALNHSTDNEYPESQKQNLRKTPNDNFKIHDATSFLSCNSPENNPSTKGRDHIGESFKPKLETCHQCLELQKHENA